MFDLQWSLCITVWNILYYEQLIEKSKQLVYARAVKRPQLFYNGAARGKYSDLLTAQALKI